MAVTAMSIEIPTTAEHGDVLEGVITSESDVREIERGYFANGASPDKIMAMWQNFMGLTKDGKKNVWYMNMWISRVKAEQLVDEASQSPVIVVHAATVDPNAPTPANTTLN